MSRTWTILTILAFLTIFSSSISTGNGQEYDDDEVLIVESGNQTGGEVGSGGSGDDGSGSGSGSGLEQDLGSACGIGQECGLGSSGDIEGSAPVDIIVIDGSGSDGSGSDGSGSDGSGSDGSGSDGSGSDGSGSDGSGSDGSLSDGSGSNGMIESSGDESSGDKSSGDKSSGDESSGDGSSGNEYSGDESTVDIPTVNESIIEETAVDESNVDKPVVVESTISEEYIDEPAVQGKIACESSKYGCCSDNVHPAHGPEGQGCCAYSNFSCCPDNLTPAGGPYGEGCDCKNGEFGCCPDEVTPARGHKYHGCGCQFEEFGCCPDQTTPASGPSFEGCGCETHPHGCCSDGLTPAQGPNMEGCLACNSKFGCCPDGVSPKESEEDQCQCHSSKYGCCPDGQTPARGPLLHGCPEALPGEACTLPFKTGTCTNYEPKWYYDLAYGGCIRFWYGGCDPGRNHFDNEDDCKKVCIAPRASSVCFLRKNAGPCEGKYNEWFFDRETKRCVPFIYGGCLGNGNRFQTKEACADLCLADSVNNELSICEKPKAEGPCNGDFPSWFYNKESGECKEFSYSGCMGNNNRFITLDECHNACKHKAKQKLTDRVCALLTDPGNCTASGETSPGEQAKWSYDRQKRRCIPFYHVGCGGNENSFESKESCEAICPTVYPPIISMQAGDEFLIERGVESTILRISVRANPPANVSWKINGREISRFDEHFTIQQDGSIQINRVTDADSGTFTVTAENGIGSPVTRDIRVTIYPIYSTVTINLQQTIFKPESEIVIPCSISGYPPPDINWNKVVIVGGRRKEIPIVEERPRLTVETFQLTSTTATSRLIIRNATFEDGGLYKCTATSSVVPQVSTTEGIKVQEGPGSSCIDRPSYKHCDKVIKHRFCGNKYYGQYCCRSCTKAGFLPGGLY